MADTNNDYAMTLYEACEYLNKSSRTISRYIRRGVLHPVAIKSRQGTLEYRFSKTELEAIKKENDEARQVEYDQTMPNYGNPVGAQFASVAYAPPVTPRATFIPNIPYGVPIENKEEDVSPKQTPISGTPASHDTAGVATKDGDIISLLKETTDMLRGQLKVKDDQIKDLGTKIDQLIERGRETNILLKGMQDKMLRLGQPAGAKEEAVVEDKPEPDSVVMADTTAAAVQPEMIAQANSSAKQKKRVEKEPRDKNPKSKTPSVKKNFFGRLFS